MLFVYTTCAVIFRQLSFRSAPSVQLSFRFFEKNFPVNPPTHCAVIFPPDIFFALIFSLKGYSPSNLTGITCGLVIRSAICAVIRSSHFFAVGSSQFLQALRSGQFFLSSMLLGKKSLKSCLLRFFG